MLCSLSTVAQVSNDTLYFEEYFSTVVKNHPILKRAELLSKQSEAYNLKAKSIWDPKVNSALDRKSFDGKTYFNKFKVASTFPTSFAVQGLVEYETNEGQFLNPEQNVPGNGLLGAGLKLPLLRGLIFDERRNIMQEAEIISSLNSIKQKQKINELFAKATKAYIDWQVASAKEEISKLGLKLSEDRLRIAKDIFESGDGPALDTIEASMDLTERKISLQESILNRVQAELNISLFLWDENMNPLETNEGINPEKLASNFLNQTFLASKISINQNNSNLPQLKLLEGKISQLQLKERLLKENTKPQLDIKWMPWQMDVNQISDALSIRENYKIGFDFEASIFNRKAKADLQLNQLKIQDQTIALIEQKQKFNILFQQINSEIEMYTRNIEKLFQNITASKQLLEAENIKFSIGESSIFLLNKRELKVLDSTQKHISTIAKLVKRRIDYIATSMQIDIIEELTN